MGKTKKLRKLKREQEMFEIFLDLEVKRQKDAFALKCIKEFVDDNILPLISEAKTTKEAWDTLERCFGQTGSIEVEDEGGSIAVDLHLDEWIFETHCAQSHVDDVCEEVTEEREKEHVDAQ